MSSKKRRIKRKIQTLVRMNQTRERAAWYGRNVVHDTIWNNMIPLGKRLGRMGMKQRVIQALRNAGAVIRGLEEEEES